MSISDWSSDVCSSDLRKAERRQKDSEDGKIASGAKALDQAMAEAGADTLGQFLNGRDEKRVRLDGDSQSYDFYPQRRHIDYEFGRIWEEQAKHHPDLLTEEARAALHRILFFQRPLNERSEEHTSELQSLMRLS